VIGDSSKTIRCYAKINLGLRIQRKREDGYHDIITVLRYVDVFDTLEFTRTPGGISMECDHAELPCDAGNLCIRAAEAVCEKLGRSGVHMRLNKRIPIGAGLGGGSSDAAGVLRALPALFGMRIDECELRSIAIRLGADVPFFLQDSTAEARGRGDILRPFDMSWPWWILLVRPPVSVSTAWAYASLRLSGEQPDLPLRDLLLRAPRDEALLSKALINDFEATVMLACPIISQVKSTLLDSGAIAALMSGSGSAVFGLFRDQASALAVKADFDKTNEVFLSAPDFAPVLFDSNL